MTPAELADLHARCFDVPRPYSEAEFVEFLASDACFLCESDAGFALGRAIAGEAELLTLAVAPERRREGIGRHLLAKYEAVALQRGAAVSYLEVAARNASALRLYHSAGYRESGRRRAYYRFSADRREDAVMMGKPLTRG